MSQLTSGTNLAGTITLSRQSDTTVILRTSGNYLDKSIALSLQAQSAIPAFSGASIINQSATVSFTNAFYSTSDLAGVSVRPMATAGRASAFYSGDVNGWVSAPSNTEAFPSMSNVNWFGTTYYITGVSIGVNKAFNVAVPFGGSTETVHFSVTGDGTEVTGFPVATVSETRSFLGLT